jgi:hypothetical protein
LPRSRDKGYKQIFKISKQNLGGYRKSEVILITKCYADADTDALVSRIALPQCINNNS